MPSILGGLGLVPPPGDDDEADIGQRRPDFVELFTALSVGDVYELKHADTSASNPTRAFARAVRRALRDAASYTEALQTAVPDYARGFGNTLWPGVVPWLDFPNPPQNTFLYTFANPELPGAIIYDFIPREEEPVIRRIVEVLWTSAVASAIIYDVIQKQAARAALQASKRFVTSVVTQGIAAEENETVGVATLNSDEGAP